MAAEKKETMPFFDSLLLIADAVKNKTASKSALETYLTTLETVVQKAAQETKQESGPELKIEVNHLESAYAQFDAGIVLIREYLKTYDEAALDKGVQKIGDSFQEMKAGILQFGLRKSALKPSRDQTFNLMYNALQAFQNQKCDESVALSMIQFHGNHCAEMERVIRRFNKAENLWPEAHSLLEKLNQSLPNTRQAIQQLPIFFEQKKFQELQSALKVLHDYWNLYHEFLEKSLSEFQKFGSQEKVCPRCGAKNHQASSVCHSCSLVFPELGIVFPQLDLSEGVVKINLFREIFEKLVNAVEDYYDGIMSSSEFLNVLNWLDKKIGLVSKQIQSVPKLPANFLEYDPIRAEEGKMIFLAVMDSYTNGLEEMKKGVSLLRDWSTSKNIQECSSGMEVLFQGAEKVQNATVLAKKVVQEYESANKDESAKHEDQFSTSQLNEA
ncbi:MAG: hypothetical protein M1169_03370 [Firmicutes bacterium]|nr:hypothetical protein [Bacillota bacterium]